MNWTNYLLNNEKLIKIICDILTSIGTVGAVIVALYFSYRSNHPRPKIRAKADFNYFHRDDEPPGTEGIPVIYVDIANISISPIKINASGWVLGFSDRFLIKKFVPLLRNDLLPQSSKLPITIDYGQNAQFLINEKIFMDHVKNVFPGNKNKFLNKLNAYFCYLFVQDSLGNFYFFRLEKDLRNKILNEILRTKTNPF